MTLLPFQLADFTYYDEGPDVERLVVLRAFNFTDLVEQTRHHHLAKLEPCYKHVPHQGRTPWKMENRAVGAYARGETR